MVEPRGCWVSVWSSSHFVTSVVTSGVREVTPNLGADDQAQEAAGRPPRSRAAGRGCGFASSALARPRTSGRATRNRRSCSRTRSSSAWSRSCSTSRFSSSWMRSVRVAHGSELPQPQKGNGSSTPSSRCSFERSTRIGLPHAALQQSLGAATAHARSTAGPSRRFAAAGSLSTMCPRRRTRSILPPGNRSGL